MTDQSDTLEPALPRLRRPEYTGANRCWPCTLLNGAILIAAGGAIWYRIDPALATAILLVGVALVWLRGYLVPGTPRVAAAVPDAVTGAHHPPLPDVDGRPDPVNAEETAVVDALIAHDVLAEDERGLHLVPAFRDRWWDAMRDLRTRPSDALVDELPDPLPGVDAVTTVEDRGRTWIVVSDGSGIQGESWLTPAMAIAEFGAVKALGEYATAVDGRTRVAAAPPLKSLLDRCPNCEAPLEITTTDTCCGGVPDVYGGPDEVLACPECDEVVSTLES